jgi:hypothetical protein
LHGAAYAVAIGIVGGNAAIGDCDTAEKFADLEAKLNGLLAWAESETQGAPRRAYLWATEKVRNDARGRLEIHENARRVRAALDTIPKPPG